MKRNYQKSLLKLAVFFLLLGIIFPVYITQAIGFDIGDILEWSWGLQIIIPRNLETHVIEIHYVPYGLPLAVTTITVIMVIMLFIEIRILNQKYNYFRYCSLGLAFFLTMMMIFYQIDRIMIIPISIYFYFIGGILTIIGTIRSPR